MFIRLFGSVAVSYFLFGNVPTYFESRPFQFLGTVVFLPSGIKGQHEDVEDQEKRYPDCRHHQIPGDLYCFRCHMDDRGSILIQIVDPSPSDEQAVRIDAIRRAGHESAQVFARLYQEIARKEDIDRAVCDYISGMSDSYAVNLYTDLFIPKAWK